MHAVQTKRPLEHDRSDFRGEEKEQDQGFFTAVPLAHMNRRDDDNIRV